MGESVIAGNRLDSPGEEMELFVAKAAICALKDGASGSGDIVGVPSVAIVANLCGSRGPRCTDSWDPEGYEREDRDAEAEESKQLYQFDHGPYLD
jgi:hypothetical protein